MSSKICNSQFDQKKFDVKKITSTDLRLILGEVQTDGKQIKNKKNFAKILQRIFTQTSQISKKP